jgi:hypothetical protein
MLKYLFTLSLLTILCPIIKAQETTSTEYPQNFFIRPLDLPPIISGNFGEIRTNHFHSGLDLKTNQREGYPVLASADGYISRIRVQIGGGGNALYISHPNGYTTVYMHLRNFNERISMSLKTYQYRMQKFDVDFPLLSVEIPVRKGDIIGWSGNTGSSGGPHLHFEIRDTKTEEAINPQLFGIKIPDQVKPLITGLYLYHLNGEPFSEHTPKQAYNVIGSAGLYRLNPEAIVIIGGESGLGIACSDKNSASENSNGPFSIELRVENQIIYSSIWERLSFSDSRSMNSHVDYPTMITTGRRIQKSFLEPGNTLKIYKNVLNNGLLNFSDQNIRNAQYIVKDIAGNQSILNFKIKYNPVAIKPSRQVIGTKFKFDHPNEFDTAGLKISIPVNTLYSDLNFVYKSTARPAGAYSPVHHVHNRLIPLNGTVTMSIKADENLPVELQSKALIVNLLKKTQGGIFENGYVKTEIRNFDSFFITTDTLAPRIVPVNIINGVSMANIPRIMFRISDNLSGIKTFNAMINGNWVLMEFEPKTGSLWHRFDESAVKGKNEFELTVSDMKDNLNTYKATFYR